MRHQKAFRKLGRSPSHRRAMFRNMVTSLLKHEKVETTVSKAKDLRRVAEKYITLGKEDTLHRRRQALAYITDKDVVHKLFADVGPRFASRPGGYTRIIRTRTRASDAAELAIVELVEDAGAKKKSKSSKAASASKAKGKAKAKSKRSDDESSDKKASSKSSDGKTSAKKTTKKKAKAKTE